MTSRDFCFWMQSLFEVADLKEFDARQTEIVKRHLALVFKHEIDPSMGDAKHQAALDAVHSPPLVTGSSKPTPEPWQNQIPGTGPLLRC